MPKFSLSQTIHAPRDRVFSLASDFSQAASFIEGIKAVDLLTEGAIAVGTRFRETRVMFGKEATEEMSVSEFLPPERYELTAESCGIRYCSTFVFSEWGDATKVSMTFEGRPLTFMAKAMAFMMAPMMRLCRKACLQDLEDLKREAEKGD